MKPWINRNQSNLHSCIFTALKGNRLAINKCYAFSWIIQNCLDEYDLFFWSYSYGCDFNAIHLFLKSCIQFCASRCTVCVFLNFHVCTCLWKCMKAICTSLCMWVGVCSCVNAFVHNLRHSVCWWVCALDLIWMVKDGQHKHLLCGDVCSGVSNSVTRVISNAKLRYCAIICTRETSTLSCATSTSSTAQGPHQPQVNISQIPTKHSTKPTN